MPLSKSISFKLLCFAVCLTTKNITAQVCSGSWALQRPASSQCVVGQWVGWQNAGTPPGCPVNPVYTGVQTNTFTFAYPVSSFSIDFRGFDGMILCARIEIRINGVFYPLAASNISDFPPGSTCTNGSFSYVTLTSDGYITISTSGGSALIGQGRITFTNVNATSVSVSTNDGSGTIFSDPFGCSVVPLSLEFFSGSIATNCKALLRWKSGIELNVRNIEVLRSVDGVIFNKVAEISPKGDNSYYAVETNNREDAYFRLRINDLDGRYEYSDIIRVKSSCNNWVYKISPNPVNSLIEIEGLQKDDRVLVKNILGQTVLIFNSPHTDNKFNLQGLASGMYFVQIGSTKETRTDLKIIKN
jgi:hypothetical protein